jgi:ubiquinone/menaquinone biosynthesis C-methylase UbiE
VAALPSTNPSPRNPNPAVTPKGATTDVPGPLQAAIENPWSALERVLDGPLHPGGAEATEALLDWAGVRAGTRVLDVGCGAGDALDRARDRQATAVGLDSDPAGGPWQVRGEMTALPVTSEGVDVVTAECVLCLAESLPGALAETRRVLRAGGRLALSDVVVAGDTPELPDPIARALCLSGRTDRDGLVAAVESAGFDIGEVRDHREQVLAMRDEIAASVDYERLLPLLGERGQRILEGIEAIERAVESDDVGYVSLVATVEG